MSSGTAPSSLWDLFRAGGFIMWPLLICSLAAWGVIFERIWWFRALSKRLGSFHLEALNYLLRDDVAGLKRFCETAENSVLPTAKVILTALDRLDSKDQRLRSRWREAVERKRQTVNLELKRGLWILGTVASASPFIGLFGTVIGILESFQEMAQSGKGGFTVVAAGISGALVATAAGIIVAVIAVMAFNALQTHYQGLVIAVRLQIEEVAEMLSSQSSEK